jgi:hypothetical protein
MLDKDPQRRPSCKKLLEDPFVQHHIEKTMMMVRLSSFLFDNRRDLKKLFILYSPKLCALHSISGFGIL